MHPRADDRDFGTSRWQLGKMLHQLRDQAEGATPMFCAVHESADGIVSRVTPVHTAVRIRQSAINRGPCQAEISDIKLTPP
jgi:hypothetical protein